MEDDNSSKVQQDNAAKQNEDMENCEKGSSTLLRTIECWTDMEQ